MIISKNLKLKKTQDQILAKIKDLEDMNKKATVMANGGNADHIVFREGKIYALKWVLGEGENT